MTTRKTHSSHEEQKDLKKAYSIMNTKLIKIGENVTQRKYFLGFSGDSDFVCVGHIEESLKT